MNRTHGIEKKHQHLVRATLSVLCAMGIGAAVVAPAPARGGGGSAGGTPATRGSSAANKAAADAQYDKAVALYKQDKFAEAQAENEKALALDPSNVNALLMRQVLEGKLAGGGAATVPAGGGSVTAPGKLSILTAQQASLIRAMEAGPNERLMGRFDPKVLEDFWSSVIMKDPLADHSRPAHDAFISATNFPAQLRLIKDSNEMKYLQGVTITSDPATMTAFRGSAGVSGFVLQNCATAECHAPTSKQAGNFRLVNPATTPEQQYTNFYILAMYSNSDGKMIDRDNPEKSLLLQYSLPYANAGTKHPKIEIRRLSGVNDPRLRAMNDWIKALAFPKPSYGIAYEVPGAVPAATSAPATRPAK